MKTITMTPAAFCAVLHLLGCEETCLLPRLSGAEEYIAGREVLCKNGWAELDLDGSLLPRPDFVRLIYDITHAEAALRWDMPDSTLWMLRAPTEMLYIEQVGEQVCMERRTGRSFLPWVRQVLQSAKGGTLTTAFGQKQQTSDFSETEGETRSRAEVLTHHLALFFGKEM